MSINERDPGWDYFYPDHNRQFPDEPFWNMVSGLVGKPPYVKFMKGTYFGYGSLFEWAKVVNDNPDGWEITGTPNNFMINPIG